MAECIYCTDTFDDEESLRSHLYREHTHEELSRIDRKRVRQSFESLIQEDITALEQQLEKEPTSKTLREAIETFERVLRQTLKWEDLDQVYHHFLTAESLLLDAIDTVVQTSGRDILLELIDDYNPRTRTGLPPGIGAIIGNSVSRDIIRTKIDEGVEAIPAAELAYLEAVFEYEHSDEKPTDQRFNDYRWGVSHAYGWGIGHPAHDVADYIHMTARDESGAKWSEYTLMQAFYADQAAATDTLARLLEDEQVPHKRFFVLSLKEVTRGVGIHTPEWNWRAELDVEVELEEEIINRLRNLVAEFGFSDVVSDEWPYTAETEDGR